MKVFSRVVVALTFSLAVSLTGCDDPESAADTQVADIAAETQQDAAPETVEDAAAETVEDAAAETVEDAGPETVEDAAAETVEDAAAETVQDAAAETVEDATAETVEDAAAETVEDAAAETVEDAATETIEDAMSDSSEDTVADTSDDVPPVSCDYNGFIPVAQDANYVASWGGLFYIAQDTDGVPVTTLNMELIAASGGATGPGTYTITDADYSTCGNCVIIWKDCDENLSNCAKRFLASSGTLTVDSYGENEGDTLSGTLTDVVLEEVTIEGLTSTPVVGGERWCLESYSFTAPVQ